MKSKRTVIIGLLGPTLDNGHGPARWERWRPTVAMCQHEDLLVHRFELLHQKKYDGLAKTIKTDICSVSPESEVRSHLIEFEDPWDFEDVYGALLDFARSYTFDTEHEEYLVHITTGTHVAQICLFLLTETHYFPARLIQAEPPPRQRDGQPGGYKIIDLDLSKYDRLASRFKTEQREGASFLKSGIATRNAAFNKLIERIEHVVIASRAPLMLTGPTGAGKSRLARRIYELKKSRNLIKGDFVEVNSATLRGDAAMSALFGHVKGAFTGAASDRAGLLRKADQGLLFLDEIGELGLDEQAMLLRAIEEKVFMPVGADREVRSEFQLIAGTNRNLASAVANGTFRDDLLARINLWTFCLPGLHQRPEDIEPNLDYELEQFSRTFGVHVTLNKEARTRFLNFAVSSEAAWPGNFRDLNAAVARMATLATGGRITVELVDEEIERLRLAWRRPESDVSVEIDDILDSNHAEKMDYFDRLQLQSVLRVCRESRSLSDAGRKLFDRSRMNKATKNDADRLRKFLSRFGLTWQDVSAISGNELSA